MKKLLAIMSLFIILGAMSGTGISITQHKILPITASNETGTFDGEIGYLRDKEWVSVGDISGTYELKARAGIINGQWNIPEKDVSGTMRVIFAKHFLIGRVTFDETGKRAPIVGFIGFKEEIKEFGGRFMSIVGPALYFKGTYQEG